MWMGRMAAMFLVLIFLALASGVVRGEGADAGPRLGKYLIHSYGAASAPPLYLGYVVLEKGGVYKVFLPGDKMSGDGYYEYDPKTQAVIWKDGPYKTSAWGGAFTVEREGKTHKIRLTRSTVATNSTDSKK
jgi:hypothetical protein